MQPLTDAEIPFSGTTYRIGNSRDFIEVAVGDTLPGPLPDQPSFRRYRAGLAARFPAGQFDDVDVAGSFAST